MEKLSPPSQEPSPRMLPAPLNLSLQPELTAQDGSKMLRGTSQQSRPREATSRCALGCAHVPAAQHSRVGREQSCVQGQRAESSAHLITPPLLITPPPQPFLPRSRCTKGNNIRQAVFLPGSGKLEGYVPHHPAAAGTAGWQHHPHSYPSFSKGCRQPCAWSSQTRPDPTGAHLLLGLPAETSAPGGAASFPQRARPSLPHLPPHSKQGTWTNSP